MFPRLLPTTTVPQAVSLAHCARSTALSIPVPSLTARAVETYAAANAAGVNYPPLAAVRCSKQFAFSPVRTGWPLASARGERAAADRLVGVGAALVSNVNLELVAPDRQSGAGSPDVGVARAVVLDHAPVAGARVQDPEAVLGWARAG